MSYNLNMHIKKTKELAPTRNNTNILSQKRIHEHNEVSTEPPDEITVIHRGDNQTLSF